MIEKDSSPPDESQPVKGTAQPNEQIGEKEAGKSALPPVVQSPNSDTQHTNPTQSNKETNEEETDRKQDQSIESLAEQTKWIAKQTEWVRYQTIAASVLGGITLLVLVYHGCIMGRQSDIMGRQSDIMGRQSDIMGRQSQAMLDQLELAYPPRVIVTSLMIAKEGKNDPPDLATDKTIEVRAFAINIGTGIAKVKLSECFVEYYEPGKLPMNKPFTAAPNNWLSVNEPVIGKDPVTGENRPSLKNTNSSESIKELAPGQIGWWYFTVLVKPTYDPERQRLYVMGQVIYLDRLNTRRATFFTREYDVSKQRFIKVENQDYETEEPAYPK
jgi:hypothetical protein